MQNLLVVGVLDGEADLGKNVEYMVLREVLGAS